MLKYLIPLSRIWFRYEITMNYSVKVQIFYIHCSLKWMQLRRANIILRIHLDIQNWIENSSRYLISLRFSAKCYELWDSDIYIQYSGELTLTLHFLTGSALCRFNFSPSNFPSIHHSQYKSKSHLVCDNSYFLQYQKQFLLKRPHTFGLVHHGGAGGESEMVCVIVKYF